MTPVSRKEDMSPRGQLKLMQDNCGDILVIVYADDGSGQGLVGQRAVVEFCTCGTGGGQSPNTRAALIELAKAMEKDNEQHPQRAGDL